MNNQFPIVYVKAGVIEITGFLTSEGKKRLVVHPILTSDNKRKCKANVFRILKSDIDEFVELAKGKKVAE